MNILTILENFQNLFEIQLSTHIVDRLKPQDFEKIKNLLVNIVQENNDEDFAIYDLVGAFKKINTEEARLFYGGYTDLKVKGRPTGYEGGADPLQRIYNHFPDLPKVKASPGATKLLPPLINALINENITSVSDTTILGNKIKTYNKIPRNKMDGLSKAMKFFAIKNIQRSAKNVIREFNDYVKEFKSKTSFNRPSSEQHININELKNLLSSITPDIWAFLRRIYTKQKYKKGYLDELVSSDKLQSLQNIGLVSFSQRGSTFNSEMINQIVEISKETNPLDLYKIANSEMKDTMIRILANDENGRYIFAKNEIDNILKSSNPSSAVSKHTTSKVIPIAAKMFKRFMTFKNPKPTANEIRNLLRKSSS